jgi:RimJ/RimL family protein N-acetyltransferase
MFPDLTRDEVFRIETARLWLRWPRNVDARDFARLTVDPEVVKQVTSLEGPFGAREADDFISAARRANAEGAGTVLAVSPRNDPSAMIGMAGLQAKGDGRTLVLGYWLGRPYRGQGLMREAIEALVDMAFVLADAQEIETPLSRETPEAAARVLASCGFPQAASDGRVRITRSAWLKARAQAAGRIALPLAAA